MLKAMHALPHPPGCGVPPAFITKEMSIYEHTAGTAADPATQTRLVGWAADFDARPQVLCHRDLLLENILIPDSGPELMRLIDFEYAGFTYYLWDLASFILEAGLREDHRRAFVECYGLNEPDQMDDLLRMEILVDYIWGLWGLTNNYREYAENRLSRMRRKLAGLGLEPSR
jgi:thiamine kinase-like enzyme